MQTYLPRKKLFVNKASNYFCFVYVSKEYDQCGRPKFSLIFTISRRLKRLLTA